MKKFWKKEPPISENSTPEDSEDMLYDLPEETENTEDLLPDPPKMPNVIPFPDDPPEDQEIINEIRQRVEEYSSSLYVGELEETQAFSKEILLPNTDEEEEPQEEQGPRRKHIVEDAPDLSPLTLSKKYGSGLKLLRLRINILLILGFVALYLAAANSLSLPLPTLGDDFWRLEVWFCGGLLAVGILLSIDRLVKDIFTIRIGLIMTLACAATVADAFTMPLLGSRGNSLPFSVVNLFALAALLQGEYLKKRGRRTACRAAVTVRNPDYVSLDEDSWSGQDAYARFMGSGLGYGSQIQGLDGTQRMMRVAIPLLTLGAVLFAALSSLGRGKPELFLWCLSASLTAAASFSAALAYTKPFDRLATRLSKTGTALGGWSGICTVGRNLLISDRDLFPANNIQIVSLQTYDSFSEQQVVACAATLVREGGLGLSRAFHPLMRQMDIDYCWVDELIHQEGGIIGVLSRGEVSIGTADFMKRTEVTLPPDFDPDKKLLCAINGHLAGAFTLEYRMNAQTTGAIRTLLKHKITPILITRDFGITMDMLKERFKLPVDEMLFPPATRRVAMSAPGVTHDPAITAVLYREGLAAYAEAVVAARRLRSSALISTWISIAGSIVGLLMVYYLTFMESYTALSPLNLLIFMVGWFIPVVLIGGMAEIY
jgi:hypothetical protein